MVTKDRRKGKGGDGGRRGAPSGDDGRRRRSGAEAIVRRGDSRLPDWVVEDLLRVTPRAKSTDALRALEEAAAAFADGAYARALRRAEAAKELTARDATTREILGLSAYRLGKWQPALAELRTYRRLSGDTAHLPIEMDCLRALERPGDVHKAWQELQRLGSSPGAMKEGRVVYGSFLLDQGEPRRAWEVVRPGKLAREPFEEDLRQWFVAARVAAHLGDVSAARRLRDAVVMEDPAFPGLADLDSLLDETGQAAT